MTPRQAVEWLDAVRGEHAAGCQCRKCIRARQLVRSEVETRRRRGKLTTCGPGGGRIAWFWRNAAERIAKGDL